MLSLLRVFVFGLEGAARRQEHHLFSCSENKLMLDPKRKTNMLAFLRFSASAFQAAKPRVWQVRWNSARRVR
jgi:hypothetical protein